MAIQRVYLIHCPNDQCPDYAILPRQSHLGRFDEAEVPATDIWPITYFCQCCRHTSEVPFEKICLENAETQNHDQIVRYDFSNGQQNSLVRFQIYTKEIYPSNLDKIYEQDAIEAIERILIPSGLWQDSYGKPEYVGIDRMRFDQRLNVL
jgi:hypothetical protein